MKYILLACLLQTSLTYAQNRQEKFELDPADEKVSGSLYNSIDFHDFRRDTTYLGVVQVGLGNAKARVVPKRPLREQFSDLLASLTGSDAGNGKLMISFRRFTFMERTTLSKETGFFYIRADLYENENEQYRWISTLDTIVQFNAMDVTQKLLRKGENLVTHFLKSNLVKRPASARSYTLQETANIDSIQKAALPVYNAKQLLTGLYETYESFRDQQPSITDFKVVENKDGIKDVMVSKDGSGALTKTDPDDYFVVVHNNVAYVATKGGYFELKKAGNDFFYTGVVKTFRSGAAMWFGLLGAVIIGPKKELTQFRMDHLNGSFLYNGKAKED